MQKTRQLKKQKTVFDFYIFIDYYMIPHKQHTTIIKESELKKDSVEYRLSLIIDNMLTIERLSK